MSNFKNVNFTNIKKDKYDFNSFLININSKNNKNLEIFQLKELYKQHKDIVVDLLIKNASISIYPILKKL